MFWLTSGKKRVEEVRQETKKGFESVKQDINSIGKWIKHLDTEKNTQKEEIDYLRDELSSIKDELENLKNVMSLMNFPKKQQLFKQAFKTEEEVFNKQTAVYPVQTGVQTGVQAPNLEAFSITERAILLVLLNSDMNLGYDDLAAMLGKQKSTIRGQIKAIKSKSEGLIEEIIEQNGKKRLYIPEKVKENLLKKQKVRVKYKKNSKKDKENE
jgi:septal ring factor EnvC (AmiA/AmiB activator)